MVCIVKLYTLCDLCKTHMIYVCANIEYVLPTCNYINKLNYDNNLLIYLISGILYCEPDLFQKI